MKDAGRYAIAEMFNYRYLSQFLWVLGNEVFAVSAGTILFIGSKFMMSTTPIKKIFKIISLFVIAMGFYFMGWIFFDPFYSGVTEITMAILFSFVCTLIFVPFLMFLTREITNVRELKESFVKVLHGLTFTNYRSTLKTAMKKDLYDEVYQEELKNQSKEFQKVAHEKAKELMGED